uniref:Uncharacterized protein n=1 Tax=Spongospora subterranea TaxID=70186 RepID=A0A0H5QRQ6_9EUKA|eukprot:CRZ04226.1 hypothetical protein [Spongospora subterranea]
MSILSVLGSRFIQDSPSTAVSCHFAKNLKHDGHWLIVFVCLSLTVLSGGIMSSYLFYAGLSGFLQFRYNSRLNRIQMQDRFSIVVLIFMKSGLDTIVVFFIIGDLFLAVDASLPRFIVSVIERSLAVVLSAVILSKICRRTYFRNASRPNTTIVGLKKSAGTSTGNGSSAVSGGEVCKSVASRSGTS